MKYKYAVSRKSLHFYHIDKTYIPSNQIILYVKGYVLNYIYVYNN